MNLIQTNEPWNLKSLTSQGEKNLNSIEKKVVIQQSKMGQAAEAENIHKRPLRISRQSSAYELGKGPVEKNADEVSKRSGVLWTCEKRLPSKFGGYLYTFKLKQEYDDVTPSDKKLTRLKSAKDQIRKMFPAIEHLGSQVLYLDPKVTEEKLSTLANETFNDSSSEDDEADFVNELKVQKQRALIFYQLGYECKAEDSGVYLNLPDKNALLCSWERLRNTQPQLPALNIIPSEGVANDLEFVEAYFKGDVLLSTGKEFIHDHLSHVLPTINMIFNSSLNTLNQSYQKEKTRVVTVLVKAYRRIMLIKNEIHESKLNVLTDQLQIVNEQLNKIEALFGALVDEISSFEDTVLFQNLDENTLEMHFNGICIDPKWEKYLQKCFGAENISIEKISTAWNLIKEIEKKFDENRKIIFSTLNSESQKIHSRFSKN